MDYIRRGGTLSKLNATMILIVGVMIIANDFFGFLEAHSSKVTAKSAISAAIVFTIIYLIVAT